jgi:hypothetical protein
MYSRRDFLRSSAAATGLVAAGAMLPAACTSERSAFVRPSPRYVQPKTGSNRTVDYRWESFFDTPMPKDVWEQRAIVGYGRVRSFTYPVTLEYAEVPGPDVRPNSPDKNWLYCPARLKVKARNLPEVTIDTIGGVLSPAADGEKVGFLPYNLMGGLSGSPTGGNARLTAHQGYIGRRRAMKLKYPTIFGYHGWENELVATITMDAVGLQKILGVNTGDPSAVMSWWNTNQKAVEQAWWYWLFDEGGDVHVGGAGRLDVRYAFDTPMQMWLIRLELAHEPATGEFVLSWDWVNMAGDMLVSRWVSEALRTDWESNSYSDFNIDMRIGPDASDIDIDTGQDYALYKHPGSLRWLFEPARGDVPSLTVEYLDESTYGSPAQPYAGKTFSDADHEFTYQPAAWDLRDGETLTLDWGDVAQKGGVKMELWYSTPGGSKFPDQIHSDDSHIEFRGPIDFTAWSKEHDKEWWLQLADPSHPAGLLPWGLPSVTFRVLPSGPAAKLFSEPIQPPKVSKTDPFRAVPTMPATSLAVTPPLPSGRTLKVDLYSLLDPHMLPERWKQYEDNQYQEVVSFKYPKAYRTSPYFPPDPTELTPYSEPSSGMRMRIQARNLPEINIDKIGGGSNPAGFLPRDLMGGLEEGVVGGTASLTSHMGYGTREREAIYRMPDYWGYYAWENFWDLRLVLDRPGAKKVLGVTDAQFGGFEAWFTANKENVRREWRQWFYREFRKCDPMAWFNYPLQVWGFLVDLESADAGEVVLNLTVLNEAQDVVIGRWFMQTFLPHSESSWEDMYLNMTIGPETSDVDVDSTVDWGLSGYGGRRNRKWWWEPFLGDNPYLSNEYREADSVAKPYVGRDFTATPSAWDLASGEQLNFHHGPLELAEFEPPSTEFPDQIVQSPGVVSMTGPLGLKAWHKAKYPEAWAAAGGSLPVGVPHFAIRGT